MGRPLPAPFRERIVMPAGPQSFPIQVVPRGAVSGTAWATPAAHGADVQIVGKVVVKLEGEGIAGLVPPELPGWHFGRQALEEFDFTGGRKLVVRGQRPLGGRAMLRRGEQTTAELSFGPGADILVAPMAGSGEATMSAEKGDWFVASGVDAPSARRWCKLPKLGIVASWGQGERSVLLYRVCALCVGTWTLSLVYRAVRFFPTASVPRAFELVAMSAEELLRSSERKEPITTTDLSADARAMREALPFQRKRANPPPAHELAQRSSGTGTDELGTPRIEVPRMADEETSTKSIDVPSTGLPFGGVAPERPLEAPVAQRSAAPTRPKRPPPAIPFAAPPPALVPAGPGRITGADPSASPDRKNRGG
ncbi:MAG: hypothetical protein IPM79_10560 [Polyangiaceae bacterium]|jgi:hypothetical protein|nr:hypothetical protein [Polyangiaceae bacterium]MBK8938063.1 hypothetical protein [Polyangiaceae bacterium]